MASGQQHHGQKGIKTNRIQEMKITVRLRTVILVLGTITASTIVLFLLVRGKYHSELNNASVRLYEANQTVEEYTIEVNESREKVFQVNAIVVKRDAVIKQLTEEYERLQALNIKQANMIGELQLEIEIYKHSIPAADTIILYEECDQEEGPFIKLPVSYRYSDKWAELTAVVDKYGKADLGAKITDLNLNIVVGEQKTSFLKRESVAIVTSDNPYLGVQEQRVMVVDDTKKHLRWFGAGAIATGIVVAVVKILL
jgi:hypothetical protein